MPEVTAGGGGHLSVPHVDGVGVDLDGRVVTGELVAVRPVGRRAPAVQEARLGERDGAGADGDQALGARPVRAQPVGQPGVGAPGAPAARDQQGVRGGRVGERVVRDEGEAAGGTHGCAVHGGGVDAVRAWPRKASAPAKTSTGPVTSRLCTSSKRTTRTVRMVSILGGRGDGRNDEYPTFPAIAPPAFPAYRPVGNLRA